MATANQEVTSVEPYKEQEPFLWDNKRYYGFISGVGAGKTAVGVMRTALNAELWNRGSMGAIVAPSTRMIKNAIFPVMSDFGLRDRWRFDGFQAEEPGFHTPDGGRLLILSAADERTTERLANLSLSYWWLDEAKETPERARAILRERLRVGNYRNGYITTTPKGYDHNYDFFVGDPKERDDLDKSMYGQATLYEASDRACLVGVPSWANPHTPEDYHEEMRNLPEEIRLQQAEGKFVEIGAGVFTQDMVNFIEPSEISEDWSLQTILSVDPAVETDAMAAQEKDTDYWAVMMFLYHARKNQLYAVDCERNRGMNLREGVSWVSRIAGRSNPKVYVESNQSQIWLKDELSKNGLNAIAVDSTQNKEDRLVDLSIPLDRGDVAFVNHPPDDATEEELKEWKKERKRLGYDPRWEDLISEMLSFPEGNHDDLLDALFLGVDNVSLGGSYNIMGANIGDQEDE